MQDKLIITTKLKQTREYIDKVVTNYPNKEVVLKNQIEESCFNLIRLSYKANLYKELNIMKDIIIEIRMLEYYMKISLEKTLISFKKCEIIGNYLLEIIKMANSWLIREKSK